MTLGFLRARCGTHMVDCELGLDGAFGVAFEDTNKPREMSVFRLLILLIASVFVSISIIGRRRMVAVAFRHRGWFYCLRDFTIGSIQRNLIHLDLWKVVGVS